MRSGSKYLWLCLQDITNKEGITSFTKGNIYYELGGEMMNDDGDVTIVRGTNDGEGGTSKFSSKDVFRDLPIGEVIIFQHQYEFEVYFSIGTITKRTENQNKTLMGYHNYSVVAPNGMTNVVNSASIYNTIEPELIEDPTAGFVYRTQEYLKDYLDKKSEDGYPIMVVDVIIGAEKQIQIMEEIKVPKVASFFGGGYNDRTTEDYADSIVIGGLLVKYGFGIVKNGGYTGLMEGSSKGVVEAGGEAIGFPVVQFGNTKGNEYLTTTWSVVDIYDRLRKLIEGTELFVIGRGGIGTLAEIMMVFDMVRKLDVGKRPTVILYGSQWHELMGMLVSDFGASESFYEIADNLEEFEDLMKGIVK